MTDFVINVEKIARKWVTLKVQNKKDNTRYYVGYALKENVLKFVPNVQIGDTIHVFANCNKIEDSFKTRYEFEIKSLAISTNEKVNSLMANLLSKKDFTVSNVVDTRINIHYEKEYCYDEQLEKLLSQARERQEQANKEKAERYWQYTLENYNEGKGYIYQLGIDILHECGDYSHDEEIEKMKKTISVNEMIRKEKKEEQERQEKIEKGIKNFAFEHRYAIGSIFIDEDKAYKVLSCHYEAEDGLSVGVMSDSWYSIEAQDVSDTEKGQAELSKYHDKIERDKKANELTKAKRKSLEKIYKYNTEKITGEHHISDFTENAITVLDTFTAYGTGEKILVKGQTVYFITNNGMDGDRWDINNIKTGGAGAYGSQTVLTENLADEINKYLELCEREERVEYMQTEEKNVHPGEQNETEEIIVHPGGQNIAEKSLEEATAIIKSTMNDIKNSYIQLGSVLVQVRDEEIYKQKYSTFADYCANELDMKKSQAYNYIKVFQLYGNNDKLSGYSFSQLNLLARKNKSVDEIINNYPATLSKRELEEKLKSEKVHPGGQTKKVKNISFDENETQLVLKALELLKSQSTDININSLIEKLGGK